MQIEGFIHMSWHRQVQLNMTMDFVSIHNYVSLSTKQNQVEMFFKRGEEQKE